MKKSLVSIALIMSALLCFVGCGNSTEKAATSPQASAAAVSTVSPSPSTQPADLSGHTLAVYCGAGMTKPFQEISDAFQAQTGCKMEVTYANAGQIQTQINTSKEGDLFIAGSADELQPVKDAVTESKDLVKHIPVLAVKSGNPLGIKGLADLSKSNVRVVLGDSSATPIGKIADKALTDAGILSKVDVVARTTTAPEIFNALSMDQCDAIIVWKENVTGNSCEIVKTTDLDKYVKTVPAASLSYSADKTALAAFLDYLNTDAAKAIWTKYGYELLS